MLPGKWFDLAFGGMDDRLAPKEGTASDIVNMFRDPDGVWRTHPGVLPVGDFTGSNAILSVRWFQPAPAIRWLVFERSVDNATSEIGYVTFPAGTQTQITTRRRVSSATSHPTQFVDVGRWLYMFSPFDAPVRWDGKRVATVGFAGPAPSLRVFGPDQGFSAIDWSNGGTKSATTQRGVGEYPGDADAPWRYGYAATVVNDLGMESPRSAVAFASGTNLNTGIAGKKLVRILTAHLPADARAIRIWRTINVVGAGAGEGVPLYFHSEWPVSHSFELLDHKSDAELGLLLDEDRIGPMPIGPRCSALWESRLWLGGMPDDPSRLRYSHAGFIEQFPEINYIPIGTSRTGAIVALHAVPRGLVVFKEGGIYLVKANPFRCETLSEEDGTPAPRAIAYVPDRGLLWPDRNGPKVMTGTLSDDEPTQVVPIQGPIRRLWSSRVGVNLERSVVVYDPDRREVWWQLPEGGNVLPTLGIVLHLDDLSWSRRVGWTISSFTRYRGRTWVGSWDVDNAPGVYVVTPAGEGFDGEPVEGQFATNPFDVGELVVTHRVELQLVAFGEVAFEVASKTDRIEDWVEQHEGERNLVHPDHDRHLWGTALWGAAYRWTDYDPAWIAVSMRGVRGREVQLRFRGEQLAIVAGRVLVDGTKVANTRERQSQ